MEAMLGQNLMSVMNVGKHIMERKCVNLIKMGIPILTMKKIFFRKLVFWRNPLNIMNAWKP
uniref:Alternative protein RBAK n=1 Tax=Homo sapiens TaxID=9606 RepID=L8E8N4_HUMAN|nr:alternative protein RBAK [Homo sapiens]